MALTRNVISGDDLMVFDGAGNSIAFATNHSLSVSVDLESIAHKDAGIWAAQTPGKINWEITSENLYSQHDFDTLFSYMTKKQDYTLFFGLKKGYEGSNEYNASYTVNINNDDNWDPDSTQKLYSGKAFITSLEVSAATGEKATFSVTFTGNGDITNKTFSAASDNLNLEI